MKEMYIYPVLAVYSPFRSPQKPSSSITLPRLPAKNSFTHGFRTIRKKASSSSIVACHSAEDTGFGSAFVHCNLFPFASSYVRPSVRPYPSIRTYTTLSPAFHISIHTVYRVIDPSRFSCIYTLFMVFIAYFIHTGRLQTDIFS